MENTEAVFDRMQSIFNEVDPVGLFSEGHPNEYNLEIKKMIAVLPELDSLNDFRAATNRIFSSSFEGLSIHQDYLDTLAQKLYDQDKRGQVPLVSG